jgi:hypothetical protein
MINEGAESVELLWHRRHAMQIAMQLPEDMRDALLVLEATKKLVLDYLGDDEERPVDERPLVAALPDREGAVVLTFPAPCSVCAAAEAKR